MEDLTWRYFGCGSQAGHYLFDPRKGQSYSSANSVDRILGNMDGVLPPYPEPPILDYRASFNRLGGLGYSALSWWDRTVDKRTGSNSTVFVSSLTITPEDMLEQAALMFPWVFRRLPSPLTIIKNF